MSQLPKLPVFDEIVKTIYPIESLPRQIAEPGSDQEHCITNLERLNKHPYDEFISFVEIGHKYTINGATAMITATELSGAFSKPFDSIVAINNIIQSRKYKSGLSEYSGMNEKEILKQWSGASHHGTNFHETVEWFMNFLSLGRPEEAISPTIEFKQFMNFMHKYYPILVPYRTEWRIYDIDYLFAGSIDMIFKSTTCIMPDDDNVMKPDYYDSLHEQIDQVPEGSDVYHIYDWKRCKKIDMEAFRNELCNIDTNVGRLEDCKYIKYSLQLNIYKYILERRYGMTIASMRLMMVHSDHDDYTIFEVPCMTKVIKWIFGILEECLTDVDKYSIVLSKGDLKDMIVEKVTSDVTLAKAKMQREESERAIRDRKGSGYLEELIKSAW